MVGLVITIIVHVALWRYVFMIDSINVVLSMVTLRHLCEQGCLNNIRVSVRKLRNFIIAVKSITISYLVGNIVTNDTCLLILIPGCFEMTG